MTWIGIDKSITGPVAIEGVKQGMWFVFTSRNWAGGQIGNDNHSGAGVISGVTEASTCVMDNEMECSPYQRKRQPAITVKANDCAGWRRRKYLMALG